jgi:opacity protein-like surface antigen
MRRQACALFTFATMICAAHAASAQSPWYITGSAGALLRSDASASPRLSNGFGTTGPGTLTATYDPGPVFNLGVGYKLPLGFRVEGELGYAHYSFDSENPLSTDGTFPPLNGSRLALQSGGGHDQYSATVNGFYDLPIPGWIVPYVGAGFGVERTNSQTAHFSGPGVQFTSLGSDKTWPVILGEVGVTITLDERWAVVPSYRFEHVFASGAGSVLYNANIFRLGVRYSF